MNDPIVNEVRKYRDEHAKKFNYDLDAIVADYQSKHTYYVAMLSDLKKKKSQPVAPCDQPSASLLADI